MGRLLADVKGYLQTLREEAPGKPIALAGISWGGKLAVITAGREPKLVTPWLSFARDFTLASGFPDRSGSRSRWRIS